MSSRLITQLPRLSIARAGAVLEPQCCGALSLLAPAGSEAAGLHSADRLRQPSTNGALRSQQYYSPLGLSRGFAASAEQQDPAAETGPGAASSKHQPAGRTCGFEHQFRVVGAVEGPYEVNPAAKFAVVEVGSHQFKVIPGDVIITEKINGVDINDKLSFSSVMMLGSASETIIGRPTIPGAEVIVAVEEQFLDAKKLSFKKRRRKNSKRLKGNRQPLTSLRVLEVNGIEEAVAPASS